MINDIHKFPPQYHPVTPYAHQEKAFNESKNLRHYALWWEMGCGKTKVIIDTAVHLFLSGEIDGLLVVSDKGNYLNWIFREVPKHIMPEITHRLGFWNSQAKIHELMAARKLLMAENNCLDIAAVNIESLSGGRGMDYARDFIRAHYTMMVVDESTSIKNTKAQRTKAAIMLGAMCDYRRVMSGTPITQSPLDVYGQCEFLQQGLLGHTSFVAFRAEYARMMDIQFPGARWPTKKILGYQNLDKLHDLLSKFSSRILKTECLDLPPKVYEVIDVEHNPVQAEAYRELKETAVLQLEQGLLTATSAMTALLKLHQINCGHLKLDDGTVVDIPSCRINALLELLDNIHGKAIIWCAFQRDVELVLCALNQRKDGYAVHYYGKTLNPDRIDAIDKFQNDEKCRWFVGTPASGGKGITLTAASYVIYYSNTFNLEHRLQSEDRAHRIGQAKSVTYIDLQVPKTIDVKILRALRTKKDLAHEVLDKFRELTD